MIGALGLRRKRGGMAACLADAPSGCRVRMAGFTSGGEGWRERLQAYGIAPGREIEIVQQKPVTVVRVDHLELALERNVASHILIGVADDPQ
jgi:Fe2+ transport system protein FeoA